MAITIANKGKVDRRRQSFEHQLEGRLFLPQRDAKVATYCAANEAPVLDQERAVETKCMA